MADAIPVFMSSRRTVMSGEVVTFATRFEPWDSAFGKTYRAAGPFDVSASRDAVMVHHAECKNREESLALALAVTLAEQVRAALAPHQRGGHPSQYPSEPTLCTPDGVKALPAGHWRCACGAVLKGGAAHMDCPAGVLVDYSFRCYSCSKEWEATTTTTDCPACGTTNNHCAANPRGVPAKWSPCDECTTRPACARMAACIEEPRHG